MPMLAAAAPRSANSTATMNSGDSETSGASHCTRRNSSMWNWRPTASRLSANGSAAVKIAPPASAMMPSVAARRPIFPVRAISSEGPSRVGSS